MRSSFASSLTAGLSLLSQAQAALLWDGRFNDLTSATDLEKWSFSNPVGPYQYYIHGPDAVGEYVDLAAAHKNPADAGSEQGVKISLTDTAFWNGQNMRRTELIPQTTATINKGKVFYHFSLRRSDVNAPAETREHQIAFFESHFTELKSGWLSGAPGTSDPALRWMVGGQTQWSVDWEADVWHNAAYEIDFAAGTVGFWHSTGASPLERVVDPVAASTSSNGADWHLGVLELPRDGYADADEDFYFSGVYIEDGEITTSVAGPGAAANPNPVPVASSPAAPATTAVAATSAAAAVPTSVAAPAVPVVSSSSAAAAVPTSVAAPAVPVASSSSAAAAAPTSAPAVEAPSSVVVPPAAPTTTEAAAPVVPTTPAAAPSAAPTAGAGNGSSCKARRARRRALKLKARKAELAARR
ncbi:hypothetical protein F5X68DRAFT_174897 [Plectosphaerella plurivora]|uniref:Glycoside hydrolase 131 catalytic N-terminal domain-containing protein n=1 Tax=Plectosphaerella plurivora TaxID=936078 RepID=A0A9P9A6I1_9PEZI|nr:hypothetical protein F5X68DRAFT_174897 [Plectosphaerella plurivora]